MSELMLKLKEKFNVSLSRFHINRIINDNNITLKITRIRHEPVKRFGKILTSIKSQMIFMKK